ncbi:MAG: hypothetical protein KBE41_05215 [Lutibacter sp.]|nr:hypothetical protein [Lutibacter sp.]MBP9600882.1 hypothetical protein [Lutibacter sp.]
MTFKQRLPFFLGGLTVGLIIVIFIWDKKGTEFNYGPNSRLLKNISTKTMSYSDEVSALIQTKEIDSSTIASVLKNGNAAMWDKVKIDSCTQYTITGNDDLENITITLNNCESTAFIEKIVIK